MLCLSGCGLCEYGLILLFYHENTLQIVTNIQYGMCRFMSSRYTVVLESWLFPYALIYLAPFYVTFICKAKWWKIDIFFRNLYYPPAPQFFPRNESVMYNEQIVWCGSVRRQTNYHINILHENRPEFFYFTS